MEKKQLTKWELLELARTKTAEEVTDLMGVTDQRIKEGVIMVIKGFKRAQMVKDIMDKGFEDWKKEHEEVCKRHLNTSEKVADALFLATKTN